MIKWFCNFSIPDSFIQLDIALIKVISQEIIDDKTKIKVVISDETGEIIVKEYTQFIDIVTNNNDKIYEHLLQFYNPSELKD